LGRLLDEVSRRYEENDRARFLLQRSVEMATKALQDLTLQVGDQHAQRLESVGRLAAGLAHEINTPMQYMGNNVTFLESAFGDLLALCAVYQEACSKAQHAPLSPEDLAQLKDAEEAADLQYLREAIPRTLKASEDGIKRVGDIVHSMKSFAHPDARDRMAADINDALQVALTLVSSELSAVADVETDFAELPQLLCYAGDLNHAFMNLLSNAGHAVAEVVGSSGSKGLVQIQTALQDNQILVRISDSGPGIAPEIRGRIFDPFFTTKPVGKGKGQGLTLARAVIVEKHGGTISFESEMGRGTSFLVHLPLSQEAV
jgi:signal transduction histidine kinase